MLLFLTMKMNPQVRTCQLHTDKLYFKCYLKKNHCTNKSFIINNVKRSDWKTWLYLWISMSLLLSKALGAKAGGHSMVVPVTLLTGGDEKRVLFRLRTATASGLASSFQTSCCALCSILGHYYCAPTVCARVRAASRWMLRRTGAQVRGLCAYAASGQAGQRR